MGLEDEWNLDVMVEYIRDRFFVIESQNAANGIVTKMRAWVKNAWQAYYGNSVPTVATPAQGPGRALCLSLAILSQITARRLTARAAKMARQVTALLAAQMERVRHTAATTAKTAKTVIFIYWI